MTSRVLNVEVNDRGLPLTMRDWGISVMAWRKRKGFKTSWKNMMEKLMLVVTELAEAAEDYRHDNKEHFKEEIADTFIRLFDICGSLGIDIESEIAKKMKTNEDRPFKHNKKC